MHLPQFPYPLIHQWTFKLLPCLGYCEWGCGEHGGRDSYSRSWFQFFWLFVQKRPMGLLDHIVIVFLIFGGNFYTVFFEDQHWPLDLHLGVAATQGACHATPGLLSTCPVEDHGSQKRKYGMEGKRKSTSSSWGRWGCEGCNRVTGDSAMRLRSMRLETTDWGEAEEKKNEGKGNREGPVCFHWHQECVWAVASRQQRQLHLEDEPMFCFGCNSPARKQGEQASYKMAFPKDSFLFFLVPWGNIG